MCAGESEGLGVEDGGDFGVDLLACAEEGEFIRGVVGWGPHGAGAAFHGDGNSGVRVCEDQGVNRGADV